MGNFCPNPKESQKDSAVQKGFSIKKEGVVKELIKRETNFQNDNPADEDEIIIISPLGEIIKLFVKNNLLVCYNPEGNLKEMELFETFIDIKMFDEWQEAVRFVQNTQLCCHIMSSSINGESLAKEVAHLPHVFSIYIWCSNVDELLTWTNDYKKIKCVEKTFENLFAKIRQETVKWQRLYSSLRVDFPAFAPIFDDKNRSERLFDHRLLKGLTRFKNRVQAKRDFLKIARAIYTDKDNMMKFEHEYNHYEMGLILNWYTRETFVYKVTNNCLRIATSDSIQYARLIIKDLETAIKEQYHRKSKHFNGLLYRGAYISKQEWSRLEQNKGKDIEIYGFISTAKMKQIGLIFAGGDIEKKAFITIVVPAVISDKDPQGFAEVSEFSQMPDEDEVLFNIRSRFTVLEAATEEIDGVIYRHLVLLYGATSMRQFMAEHQLEIEIQVPKGEELECNICCHGLNKEGNIVRLEHEL